MGMRNGMDSVFGLHHFAHAHNAEVGADSLGGMDARSMKASAGEASAVPTTPTDG
jgi:enoyl-CoA hydratase